MGKVGWFCELLDLHGVAIYSETSEASGYVNGNKLCKTNAFCEGTSGQVPYHPRRRVGHVVGHPVRLPRYCLDRKIRLATASSHPQLAKSPTNDVMTESPEP